MCQKYWLIGIYSTSNYQNFIEMTSNMIYIVAPGVGLKCPCKINLNTQCPLNRIELTYLPKSRASNPCSPGPTALIFAWSYAAEACPTIKP